MDTDIMNHITESAIPTLRRLGASLDMQDEIVQQTAIRLWEKNHWSLSVPRRFVRVVARNLFLDACRKTKLDSLPAFPETHRCFCDQRWDPATEVRDDVAELAESHCPEVPLAAEILSLTIAGAHSPEIALKLCVPAGTIRRRLSEIRRALRPILA